jgi:hypothetical protein
MSVLKRFQRFKGRSLKKRPLENIHHDAQKDHAMEEGSEVEDA